MAYKQKRRCQCHKPRHKRKKSQAILVCDVILGLMAAVFIFFFMYNIVLPWLGVEVDLTWLINELYSGLWFVALLIIVNIGWMIYFGCHKSTAGMFLSFMTAFIMIYTYYMN